MVEQDQYQSKEFTRRAFLVGGLQGALLGVLGGRLAWLQFAQGEKYKTLSDKNRINTKILVPSRGVIYDRNGIPLAVNEQNFRLLVVPEQVEDLRSLLEQVKPLIDLSDDHIEDTIKAVGKSAKFLPVEVDDQLEWDDVAKIEVRLPELTGLSIDVGELRHYPMGEAGAHVVGYVGAVNERDLEQDDDPVLKLPGIKVGKIGMELVQDKSLRGKGGAAQLEVNVSGRSVRELDKLAPEDGQPLTLSIDSRLQQFAQNVLAKERSASAIVMDAYSGAVYCMVSSPSFDPNLFVKGISHAQYNAYNQDIALPLYNKAVAGQYPPASTFKMITALAALEAGIINKKSSFYCSGYFEYGTDRFHCWKHSGHGWVNLTSSLMRSCDVYFYEIAAELGIERMANMARRFGLGQDFNFDLREAKSGLVPDKRWKYGKFGQKWKGGETINSSIGQGYLLATPLQLAVMTARLVNGGLAVEPWLVPPEDYGRTIPGVISWPKVRIAQEHLDMVRPGMDAVTNDREGTAYASRIDEEGLEMGGKTGTAQVQRITKAMRQSGIKNEDLSWKQRHHALFVGYAPVSNPRYVVSVVVEHGIGGSRTAAPLARDILLEAQRLAPAKSKMFISEEL